MRIMSKASKTSSSRKAPTKRVAGVTAKRLRASKRIDTSDFPEIRDWSGAVRGRFFTGDQTVLKPVFVDREVMDFLTSQAKTARKNPDELANDLLRRDIDLIRAAGG
jgi:hypothetical protein